MPDLVWNELSVVDFRKTAAPPFAQNSAQARNYMDQMVGVMRAWSQAGLPRVLRIPLPITTADLAPGYRLQQWRNDPQADRDQQRLVRLYAHRTPALRDLLGEACERS